MTRTEIIAFATTKLGLTDAATLTIGGTFFDMRWAMLWNEALWRQTLLEESLVISAGSPNYTLNEYGETLIAATLDRQRDLTVFNNATARALNPAGYTSTAGGPVWGVVVLNRTSNTMRLRVLDTPTQAGLIVLTMKRKVLALAGGDTPPIPGADIALCEFLMGDLYEWLRQFSKAEYFFKKGGILVENMKEIETNQSTELRQIVPEVQSLEDGGAFDSFRPLG